MAISLAEPQRGTRHGHADSRAASRRTVDARCGRPRPTSPPRRPPRLERRACPSPARFPQVDERSNCSPVPRRNAMPSRANRRSRGGRPSPRGFLPRSTSLRSVATRGRASRTMAKTRAVMHLGSPSADGEVHLGVGHESTRPARRSGRVCGEGELQRAAHLRARRRACAMSREMRSASIKRLAAEEAQLEAPPGATRPGRSIGPGPGGRIHPALELRPRVAVRATEVARWLTMSTRPNRQYIEGPAGTCVSFGTEQSGATAGRAPGWAYVGAERWFSARARRMSRRATRCGARRQKTVESRRRHPPRPAARRRRAPVPWHRGSSASARSPREPVVRFSTSLTAARATSSSEVLDVERGQLARDGQHLALQ